MERILINLRARKVKPEGIPAIVARVLRAQEAIRFQTSRRRRVSLRCLSTRMTF
jgi:hypothetical protein